MSRGLGGMGSRTRRLRCTVMMLRLMRVVAMRCRMRTGLNHHGGRSRARLHNNGRRRLHHRHTNGYIHLHCGFGLPSCGCYNQHTGYTKQTFYYFVHNAEMGYCTK